jgi:hypothetical protein
VLGLRLGLDPNPVADGAGRDLAAIYMTGFAVRSILFRVGSTLLAVGLLVSTMVPPESATADVLGGAADSVLGRPAQAQPGSLGDGSLGSLQYANPTEQMVVMAPPQPNSQGGAQLQHPLLIPGGRGIAPSLVLTYASTAGSSWVGTGWDLSVGDISVDTRWGVPRYDQHKETETYLLDGKQLSPTAVRSGSALPPRVTDQSDFTFRTETAHDLIIRHGTNPKDYWWEVRDKSGGIRWYGGFPDAGGPNVNVASNSYPSLKQDPAAILFDDNGNAYRWGLSAERDSGVNLIRYFYDKVDGQRVGASEATVGRQMYLSKIRYTGAASGASAPPDDPAYEVRFLRAAAVNTAPSDLRKDVSVSGRGGFLEVTSDLLRRVEIWYGAPAGGGPRNYNIPSRSYDLNYTSGEFGKSLLQSVDQRGSDGQVYARHMFDYFDSVRDPSTGALNGWSAPVEWAPPSDNLQQTLVTTTTGPSVLGGSVTNSGDGHAFIGFNADNPTKEGAFGGMFSISAGATEAQAEFIDINGDGLPDKVFREGDAVFYRVNTSGPNLAPGATPTFGGRNLVANLHKLSTETNIGLAGGVEADIGVDIQFTVGGDVTIGEDYFADVNGDGLPDFVSGGVVYFDHLDANGISTFEQSSANTAVPINTTTTTVPANKQITDLENQRRAQSPLQDTVGRWVAPFNGTIAITGPVTLDPFDTRFGDTAPFPPYKGNGVTASIQQNGNRLWNQTLTTPGPSPLGTPTGVSAVNVVKGDRIYFRLQSGDDGARDQVQWDPKIAYTFTAQNDVNNLSQGVFQQSRDFTLAGRPHTFGLAPMNGTLRFQGTLHKTRATTDDVTVQVLLNGNTAAPVVSQVVPAATGSPPADTPLTPTDFKVVAPTLVNGAIVGQADKVEVKIAADSPIDASAVALDYQLFYVKADNTCPLPPAAQPPNCTPPVVDSTGQPLKDANGSLIFALQVPADTDIYPQNSLTAPNTPWASDLTRTVTAHASLNVGPNATAGDVVVTVKTSNNGLLGKKTISVPVSTTAQNVATDFDIPLTSGTGYWSISRSATRTCRTTRPDRRSNCAGRRMAPARHATCRACSTGPVDKDSSRCRIAVGASPATTATAPAPLQRSTNQPSRPCSDPIFRRQLPRPKASATTITTRHTPKPTRARAPLTPSSPRSCRPATPPTIPSALRCPPGAE